MVALVFLDLDVIVVSLGVLRFMEEEVFRLEVLKTMEENRRKAKEAIFIVKKKKLFQYLCLTDGAKRVGTCHLLRGEIETV